MRDANDTCITICGMENVDPMGIHTGESVVVAPILTLRDDEFHLLRNAALKIIRALDVQGGCNIQFAFKGDDEYRVIEVNARLSRSSALASKATGYPIARIAAKLAIGYTLDEIPNDITKKTPASFEPTIDYVVVKWPRFAFEKFAGVDARLSTHMKSVGEAMAIGRTFKQAFGKALRSRELDSVPSLADEPTDVLLTGLEQPTSDRFDVILELFRRLQQQLDLSIILVTHDLGVVAELCDDVLVLYGGRTVEYAGVDAIFNEPLHPYTQRLLRAFPDIEQPTAALAAIPGYPPPLDALPPPDQLVAAHRRVFDDMLRFLETGEITVD